LVVHEGDGEMPVGDRKWGAFLILGCPDDYPVVRSRLEYFWDRSEHGSLFLVERSRGTQTGMAVGDFCKSRNRAYEISKSRYGTAIFVR
jgi:hypothetical protein